MCPRCHQWEGIFGGNRELTIIPMSMGKRAFTRDMLRNNTKSVNRMVKMQRNMSSLSRGRSCGSRKTSADVESTALRDSNGEGVVTTDDNDEDEEDGSEDECVSEVAGDVEAGEAAVTVASRTIERQAIDVIWKRKQGLIDIQATTFME